MLILAYLVYHVVHDNTCHHDIKDGVQIPLSHKIFDYVSHALQDFKCMLYVFPCTLLTFGKMIFLLSLGFIDGLHKTSPQRIYLIYKQVVARVYTAIDLKNIIMPFLPATFMQLEVNN